MFQVWRNQTRRHDDAFRSRGLSVGHSPRQLCNHSLADDGNLNIHARRHGHERGAYERIVIAALMPMPACVDIQVPVICKRVVTQLAWRMANREAPGPEGVVVPPRLVPPD